MMDDQLKAFLSWLADVILVVLLLSWYVFFIIISCPLFH